MNQSNFEYKSEPKYENANDPAVGMEYMGAMDGACCQNTNAMCPPVRECPQERVCHRYLCYEVPHITPCNTRVINHHVYRHTFTPCYTCCEENVVSNVYDRKCCF